MFFFAAFAASRFNFRANRGDVPEEFFPQYIDHQNKDYGTFQQRYYVVDKDYKEHGPIILDIGGESDNNGAAGNGDLDEAIAKKLGAKVITLEHRFFGKSHPFKDTKVDKLKYLTVQQALDDLVYFKKWYTENVLKEEVRWMVIGGSYPGLLSAYARTLYPNEFQCAISSSGVVLASNKFDDFDRQIAISMGQSCAAVARRVRRQVEALLDDPTTTDYVLELFGAKGVEKETFRFVLGEIFSIAPQYGKRDLVCGPLEDTLVTGEDPMMALAKFSREFFVPKFCDGDMAKTYSNAAMKETGTDGVGARMWLWMTCNELAYWQVAAGRMTLRSPKIDQEYFHAQCEDVFGTMPIPDTDAFNAKYGGLAQNGTNIFYTTGSQDPWTSLCITDGEVPEGCYAHTMTGPDVAHCRDLHGDLPTDPADVRRTRRAEIDAVVKWMNE